MEKRSDSHQTAEVFLDATEMRGTGELIIELEGVDKYFGDFQALKGINMKVARQEVVVVIGPSGSGKSTLIRCINRLETHDRGRIVVDNIELTDDIRRVQEVRAETGMVFQQFNLFPHLTVMDNITLGPRQVRRMPKKAAEDLAMEILTRVKIPEQARKFPGQLSGGQQQRVAIARALVNEPAIILADEPTGNLDSKSGTEIMNILLALNESRDVTLIIVTHDAEIASHTNRIVTIRDGRVEEKMKRQKARP